MTMMMMMTMMMQVRGAIGILQNLQEKKMKITVWSPNTLPSTAVTSTEVPRLL